MFPGLVSVFLSGAAVMVVEIVSARLTAPYFGQSSATWAALAGVTLLGVTLGNFLGGVLAQRARRPLAVGCAGAAGGAAVLFALPSVLPALARAAGPGDLGLTIFAFAAFLPPTALVGLVSPSVAAAFVRADRNGRDLGILYCGSMTGAMLGSAAGGFLLPFVMTTSAVCTLQAALLAAVAAVLLACVPRRVTSEAAPGGARLFAGVPPRVLLNVFIVGFVGMASELSLARLVTPVLGGSHIVWSSIFVTFIGCMGVGGLVGGRIADRWARILGDTILYVSLAVMLYLTVLVETRLLGLWTLGLPAAARIALHVFAGFAPYAFTLGMVSAVLMQKATAEALRRGERAAIGLVYAVSGVGSSAGSFFAGMLFTSAAGALAFLPGATRPLPAEIALDDSQAVVMRGESSYNSVTVTERKDRSGIVTIWLDRIPHTSVQLGNRHRLMSTYTRLLDVAVDVFARPRDRRVFVIGGGGYALPRKWNAERGKYAEVSVAEIDPLVSRCAHAYMDAPADNEVVHDHVGDGRRIVDGMVRRGETNRYDVVVGDTIGDAAIPYHLTTAEFFGKIRNSLLTADGVYLMHVLDVHDDPGILSSIVRTLRNVYPHVVACSYDGTRDVRHSWVVAASRRELSVHALADELVRRHPEAIPIALDGPAAARLAAWEGAVLLRDDFAPVERFVWRVMSRDVQYRAYARALEMKEVVRRGDIGAAVAMAAEVLALQPEQTGALEVLADAAADGDRKAEAMLRAQADRPSIRDEAKVRYAAFLHGAGRTDEARARWRGIVRRWPDNPHYRRTLRDLEAAAAEREER